MNEKTENGSEISPLVRRWLIALTLLALVLVFVTEHRHERQVQLEPGFEFTLYPWVQSTAITVSGGLERFSGRSLMPPTTPQRLSLLVGVLLSLVVAPSFLLLGWRYSVLNRREGRPPSSFMTLIFMVGGILTVAVAFPSIPYSIERVTSYRAMRDAQDLGTQRDNLIHQLTIVAREARQHWILPVSARGGNGSFKGFSIPETLRSTEDATFEVAQAEDALVLKAELKRQPGSFITLSMDGGGKIHYAFEGF